MLINLIGDGLGHVYKQEMISNMMALNSGFSLQYDETTQALVKKIDLLKRYWSPAINEVWCLYYELLFYGNAKGEDVAVAIIKEMRYYKEMSLGSDVHNINKAIWRQMEIRQKVENLNYLGLVDVET